MAEGDHVIRRLAARHVEPRQVAGGRGGAAVLGVELHAAFGGAEAQPRQRVDDHAQPRRALQAVVPFVGLVAVHLVHEHVPVGAAQHGLHLGRQLQGAGRAPLRQHAGVHHQHAALVQRQRAVAQPIEQRVAVGRRQDVAQRIRAVRPAHALRHHQQVQVVVAQQAGRRIAQRRHAPQHGQRFGTAVDQIAQQHQAVTAGRESDFVEQPAQCGVAALHVADQIKCHVFIFHRPRGRPAWTSC